MAGSSSLSLKLPLKRSRPLRFLAPGTSPESDSDDDLLISGGVKKRVDYKSSHGGGQSSTENEEDAQITMTVSDVGVLDCPICFTPLTIPVYQCANGHTTCSNCFPKLRDKCPTCSEKLGKIRCRAIERIIESAEIPCVYQKYGCSLKLRYTNKHSHEDQCSLAPFGCPLEPCNFRGSLRKIKLHVHQKHRDSVVGFNFNSSFSIPLNRLHEDSYYVVLEEERNRTLFVLICTNYDCVKIWSFGSSFSYAYALMAKEGRNSQWFQSTAEKAVGAIDDPLMANSLVIPGYLFGADNTVELKVCIWSKMDASDADICKFVCDSLKAD